MRLTQPYFSNDVLDIAPDLLGKKLVRVFNDGRKKEYLITETEAYRGQEDLACHANKGRTARTEVMFHDGGLVYVYLIYGIYWMLNIVTGEKENPQAVLIRGLQSIQGPGRVGKKLQLDKSFYGEDIATSQRIWIEDVAKPVKYIALKRIGIAYAGDKWINKPWRFVLQK
ncbi:MAG: DNA-3-methyladenine glycosylase [Psychromonas sp.]|jgi:DNA-3-methyladenine glycosylase|uniref:DNA-3-methyladenine glycosylase n=1 Tax=Psychromonas sp. TaxID=1884585 RepID=UPI0039E473D6